VLLYSVVVEVQRRLPQIDQPTFAQVIH
jgi:hypothetical protein